VTTSLRGVVNVDLEVEVLSQGQHSGSASGVVPSSFRILRELLDRVEDATTGEVLVPQLSAKIPDVEVRAASALAAEFGDIIGRELPTLEGVELMVRVPKSGSFAARGTPRSRSSVSVARRCRDRRQRPSPLDDRETVLSPAAQR